MEFIKKVMQLLNEKKYDECLSKCKKKLQIDPENSIAMFGVSYCLFLKGDYEKSIEFADKNELKIREHELLVLIEMVKVYNLVSMNKFDEDMKFLLDKLRKEENEEVSNNSKFFIVLYHIFNSDLKKAKENYDGLDINKKKEIMNYLLNGAIKGKTAEMIKRYLNF
jgi:tetratricopeptide (TPR) repeat protein